MLFDIASLYLNIMEEKQLRTEDVKNNEDSSEGSTENE